MPRRSLLPWSLATLGLVAAALTLWRPDGVARRLGLDDHVAARHQAAWARRMRGHLTRLDANVPAGATIFIGASTVQGLATARVRACSVNFGIGGETARELATRLADYPALDRAAAIVVMTGLNDVLRGDDADLAASYRRLAAALPSGPPVVWSSLPRLAERRHEHAAVIRANAAAKAACAARAGCRFVDLHGAMSRPAALLEPDGIHLGSAGYALWSRLLRDQLAAAGVTEAPCTG